MTILNYTCKGLTNHYLSFLERNWVCVDLAARKRFVCGVSPVLDRFIEAQRILTHKNGWEFANFCTATEPENLHCADVDNWAAGELRPFC